MAKSEDNMNFAAILKDMYEKIKEEQSKMGKVNILIAGKTGVGKSTLVNAVFGKTVATTGTGRPVTDEIRWYEPVGLPVRLCDTKGLELAAFNKILADLEAEIERGIASGKIEDRVHILWLCIAEPGGRVEKGEEQLIAVCERHRIPAIVVLTKAIGPRSFRDTVKKLLPGAKNVIRVLAEEWDDDPPRKQFGLRDLIEATHDLLPEATKNAFDAAQRIVLERKRDRALKAAMAAAAAAATAAAVPIPVADAAAVLSVNIGMIASVSVYHGRSIVYGQHQNNCGFNAGSNGRRRRRPFDRGRSPQVHPGSWKRRRWYDHVGHCRFGHLRLGLRLH